MADEKDDLPKSIVVILVVLAVAISVLGTITAITEINRIDRARVHTGTPTQTGRVSLEVIEPMNTNSVTGKITFEVRRPEVN